MSHEQIKQVTDHTICADVKRFGKAVVEVKILDPDSTDLVFVNLPGTSCVLPSKRRVSAEV